MMHASALDLLARPHTQLTMRPLLSIVHRPLNTDAKRTLARRGGGRSSAGRVGARLLALHGSAIPVNTFSSPAPAPVRFFDVLATCCASNVLLPQVQAYELIAARMAAELPRIHAEIVKGLQGALRAFSTAEARSAPVKVTTVLLFIRACPGAGRLRARAAW